jgi:hypothetical protein
MRTGHTFYIQYNLCFFFVMVMRIHNSNVLWKRGEG